MPRPVDVHLPRRGRATATTVFGLVVAAVAIVAACTATPTSDVAAPVSTAAPRTPTLTVDDSGQPLPDGVRLSEWQELLPGLRLRRGTARFAFGLIDSSRPQQLTVAEIDLTTPGLRFVTHAAGGVAEPPRPGHQVHTAGGGLSDLVAARPEVRVAINGNYFWPCCYPAEGEPVGTTLFGLAVDGGRVVSDPAQRQTPAACTAVAAVPDDRSVGAPALLIDQENRATFRLVSATTSIPSDIVAAVAGGPQPDGRSGPCGRWNGYPPNRPVPGPAFLLEAGVDRTTPSTSPPEGRYARSFVGRSADGRRLYLATIDGSESTGAAFADEAGWLRVLGAADGLNLDGGGSSILVLRTTGLTDPPASPCPPQGAHNGAATDDGPADVLTPDVIGLNVVDNGTPCRERQIGTYLGAVFAPPAAG